MSCYLAVSLSPRELSPKAAYELGLAACLHPPSGFCVNVQHCQSSLQ